MAHTVLGERLRALRMRAGMTQQAIADHLSIHRTAYTKYETTTITPDPQAMLRLAELFGVSVDYLLGREEEVVMLSDSEDSRVMLSQAEKDLLLAFRQLSYAEQQVLIRQAQAALRAHQQKKQ